VNSRSKNTLTDVFGVIIHDGIWGYYDVFVLFVTAELSVFYLADGAVKVVASFIALVGIQVLSDVCESGTEAIESIVQLAVSFGRFVSVGFRELR
jgi:hypothetical protein